MSIQSDVVTALAGIADDRVYPNEAPEKTEFPYVVFQRISHEPLMTLAGYAGVTKSTFMFECWAKTYAEAMDLAEDVRTAIEAAVAPVHKFREVGDPDDHEPAVGAYVEPVLFSFWHA